MCDGHCGGLFVCQKATVEVVNRGPTLAEHMLPDKAAVVTGVRSRLIGLGLGVLTCVVIGMLGKVLDSLLPWWWRASIRDAALAYGVPQEFVTGGLAFALLRIPEWMLLGIVLAIMRLWGGPRGSQVGMYTALMYPVVDICDYIVVCKALGLPVSYGERFWSGTVMVSLLAMPYGLAVWWLAGAGQRALARRRGYVERSARGDHEDARESE